MEVTARELKLRLGRCLAAVRSGETVRVTLRGKLVAEIRPVSPQPEAHLAAPAASGLLRPGKGQIEPLTPQKAQRSASTIVLSDRESEP